MKKIYTIILLFIAVAANAVVRSVPAQYSLIQSAINSSVNGDTVLVEPGTYFENINFLGKKIVVTSRFYINSNLSYIQNTIINGSTPLNPDSASCVRFYMGEDSTTVLQGFTITGGTGTKWADEHGAGIYREGGGILVAFCSPIIKNNIIKNNEAMNSSGINGAGGGGLRIGDGNPKILDNIIIYNKGKYGAGVVLNYTGAVLKNNLICYNSQSSTYLGGAGIWANNTPLSGKPKIIENNTIIHNSSTLGTGGILSYYGADLTLKNNIIWGNTTPFNGAQIYISGSGAVNAEYCCIQGGYTGTGNINVYPQFADTNFILANGSPCIDAGDSSSVYYDPADSVNAALARFPSKGSRRNDIGAYGGPASVLLSGTTVIGIKSNNTGKPEGFLLYQNYPNPFNPSTSIRYKVESTKHIILVVFNILGKEIATLVNEKQAPGMYDVNFSGINIPSGVYVYKLITEGFSEEKKMILLK